jgi:Protein of unknown function (DUF3396)
MSTAELFLEEAEIAEFVRETTTEPQWFFGYEGRELGICPYITFYVYHDEDGFLPVADQIIEIFKSFESSIIDVPFAQVRLSKEDDWLKTGDPRLLKTDLRNVAKLRKSKLETLMFGGTDMESTAQSALWSIMASVDSGNGNSYTRLKLTFRHKWYRQNRAKWHTFVEDCLKRLKPEHCYSGFEVGNGDFNIIGSYEADVLERVCADYFYGMDIDHPGKMSFHNHLRPDEPRPNVLGAGIRTPTWSFMLSPYWQGQLGKTEAQIRAELDDPRIVITAIDYPKDRLNPEGRPGLWIRLGELDLHPVDKGVPELLVKANRLIRPIRCDYLKLLTLDPWDDDPNPRFDFENSQRWMRRFDRNSEWPNLDTRLKHTPPEKRAAALRCLPGERVPQSGLWWTPAIKGAGGQRQFEAGQTFPSIEETDWGKVIWYLD